MRQVPNYFLTRFCLDNQVADVAWLHFVTKVNLACQILKTYLQWNFKSSSLINAGFIQELNVSFLFYTTLFWVHASHHEMFFLISSSYVKKLKQSQQIVVTVLTKKSFNWSTFVTSGPNRLFHESQSVVFFVVLK